MKRQTRILSHLLILSGALPSLVVGVALLSGGVLAQQPPPPQPQPQPSPSSPPPQPQPAPAPAPSSPPPQPGQPPPLAAPPAPAKPALTPEQAKAQELATEGLQLLQQGDLDAAASKFNDALAQDGQNVIANTFLGFIAFRRGDLDGASRYCSKALQADTKMPLALLLLGRAKEATGDVPAAKDFYLRAAQAGAASPTAHSDGGLAIAAHARYLIALQEEKEGNHTAALSDLDETLRVFPKNVNAMYEKGLALLALGKNEEAAEAFGKSLSERAGWYSPEAWLYPIRRYLFLEENSHYWRGVALHKAGRLQEAANELSPLLPIVESRIGSETLSTSSGSSKTSQALEGELDLSYYDAHMEMARVLKDMGQRDRAVATLRAFMKLERSGPQRIAKAKELLREIR